MVSHENMRTTQGVQGYMTLALESHSENTARLLRSLPVPRFSFQVRSLEKLDKQGTHVC